MGSIFTSAAVAPKSLVRLPISSRLHSPCTLIRKRVNVPQTIVLQALNCRWTTSILRRFSTQHKVRVKVNNSEETCDYTVTYDHTPSDRTVITYDCARRDHTVTYSRATQHQVTEVEGNGNAWGLHCLFEFKSKTSGYLVLRLRAQPLQPLARHSQCYRPTSRALLYSPAHKPTAQHQSLRLPSWEEEHWHQDLL